MSDWKSNLIDAYRLSTTPIRAWRKSSLVRAGQLPVFVLFYHRVSDRHTNPWSMTCKNFEQQIDWLQDNFQLAGLDECQQIISSGFNQTPTLAITFDDGYAENLEFALPMLIERRIPFTYFVAWGHIIEQRPFEHDVDRGVPLPVHTPESILALANAGVEIGLHTRNHVNVGEITDKDELYDELVVTGRELAAYIEKPVRYFAFPYGQYQHLTAEAFQLLKAEGFQGACTTLPSGNPIGEDPFQINRYHGDPSLSRIKNWLSFDPRLPQRMPFHYET